MAAIAHGARCALRNLQSSQFDIISKRFKASLKIEEAYMQLGEVLYNQ